MSDAYKVKYSTAHDSLHWRILEGVRARKKLTMDKMSDRITAWNKIDERVLGYIKQTAKEADLAAQRDAGVPQYTTVQVPWALAILLAMHTYLVSVFLGRSPIFQFRGRHGEAEDKVLRVEALMEYQTSVGEMEVPLFVWLYDMLKYGIGVVGHYWDEEEVVVSKLEMRQASLFGVPFGKKDRVKVTEVIPGYHGGRLYNVRPHDWLYDVRVPMTRFQEGEYCGRLLESGWNTLLEGEARGEYFNLDELKKTLVKKRLDRDKGSQNAEIPSDEDLISLWETQDEMRTPELTEMVIELVPNTWGLGQGTRPEKWVFTVGEDEVVIGARPLAEYHNKFPYQIATTDFNTHAAVTTGALELMQPMEEVLTWLFNSHFWNVRKVMNDQLVVDPSRIEMRDLLEPLPGGLIRVKPSAYGMRNAAKESIFQLQTVDVTRTHMQDSSSIFEIMQRLYGLSDSMMSAGPTKSRTSATEVRMNTGAGVARMKTISEYVSAMGFAPLAQMMLQSTQQHYEAEMEFRVAGDQADTSVGPSVQIKPEEITGFYDFIPVDGTQPIDRYAQAALFKDIIGMASKVPQVLQTYDLGKLFTHLGRLSGLRNIEQFKVKVQPNPLQAMQMAQAAGGGQNVGGANGGAEPGRPEIAASGAGAGGGGEVPAGVSRPAQVSGMGPTQ